MIKIDDKEIRNPIEQIKKNMDDIEKLKDQIYEVYNYNGVIGSTEIPYVNRSSTNVPEDVNKGWLVDYTGKLFKITGGNTTTLLLDYYANIKGPTGNTGPQGEQGPQGNPGVGIVSIEKTDTEGFVDTYTITYSNGTQSTYTITNGQDGYSIYYSTMAIGLIHGYGYIFPADIQFDGTPQVHVNDLIVDPRGYYGYVTNYNPISQVITVYTLGSLIGPEGPQGLQGIPGLSIYGASCVLTLGEESTINIEETIAHGSREVQVGDLIVDINGIVGYIEAINSGLATVLGMTSVRGPQGNQGPRGKSTWFLDEALSTTIGGTITILASLLPDALTGDIVIGNNGYLGTLVDNDTTYTITTQESIIGPAGSYTAGTGIDITSDVISVDDTVVALQTDIPTNTSDLTNDGSDGTSTYVEASDLATVATTGDYDDLLDKPDLSVYELAADAFSGDYTDLTNKPDLSIYAESSDLATVATTGDYDDLLNKPTIPAAQVNSDWNAASGVAQILNKPTLATVATTGDYTDLTNTPTIPTVPITEIQVNSTTVSPVSGVVDITVPDAVVANPTLAGTESDLTGLQIGSTKYKVPSGGGSGVSDVQVNGQSVVTNNVADIDLSNYDTLNTNQTITGAKEFSNIITVKTNSANDVSLQPAIVAHRSNTGSEVQAKVLTLQDISQGSTPESVLTLGDEYTHIVLKSQDTPIININNVDKTIATTDLIPSVPSSLPLEYATTAPSAANTTGLKGVVLTSEPSTYYNGYIYFITEA